MKIFNWAFALVVLLGIVLAVIRESRDEDLSTRKLRWQSLTSQLPQADQESIHGFGRRLQGATTTTHHH
eukprot:s4964_g6.t1